MTRKHFRALLLTLLLCIGLGLAVHPSRSQAAEPVQYVDADGTVKTITEYAVLGDDNYWTESPNGWYYLDRSVSGSSASLRLPSGTDFPEGAHLILKKGVTMTFIDDNYGNPEASFYGSLTIYQGSGVVYVNDLPQLKVGGNILLSNYISRGQATSLTINGCGITVGGGIVSYDYSENYTAGYLLTINRGVVNVTGNSTNRPAGSSIGGNGMDIVINGGEVTTAYTIGGHNCNVTINGGNVTARRGIGTGNLTGVSGGSVTINGGTVTASTTEGAAIGSYLTSNPCNVTITGGTVSAASDLGPGISSGGGNPAYANSYPGSILITGGTVSAVGSSTYSAIGPNGISTTAASTVTIRGGNVTAKVTGNYSAAIGTGNGTTSTCTVNIEGGIISAQGGYNITTHIGSGQKSSSVTVNYTGGLVASGTNAKNRRGSIRFYGTTYTLPEDFTIPSGYDMTIRPEQTMIIPKGVTLTCAGTLARLGVLQIDGALVCAGHSYTNGACTKCGEYQPPELVDGVYEINNVNQLLGFAALVNGGEYGASAVLKNNISLNGKSWTPIGTIKAPYTGTFDGQDYTISYLTINNEQTSYAALFGVIGNGGAVRNVNMTNITITGRSYVAAIAGMNNGTIADCHVSVTLKGSSNTGGISGSNSGTISGCTSSGTIYNRYEYCGGIASDSSGTITGCSSTATVTGDEYAGGITGRNWFMGRITGCTFGGSMTYINVGRRIGGIAGANDAAITGCVNNGTVSGCDWVGGIAGVNGGGTIQHCLNTGAVSGSQVAGIAGTNNYGTISGCLNTGTISDPFSTGLTGAITSSNTDGTVTNSCWLTDCGAAGEGTAVNRTQLRNGEAAFLLGDGWGQTIGTDALPVYGGAAVYQYLTCGGTARYSNTDLPDETHNYTDGTCSNCGAVEPPPALIASGWSGSTTWTLNELGVLTFSGTGNMKNYGYTGSQPWMAYADRITTVVIGDGVTAVGTGAFMGLTKLESVTLPAAGLSKIGEAAFYGCTALKEITIPEGVYTIWSYTFKGCTSLSKVKLPKTLIKIDQGAFENCTALTYMYFPTNLEIIGSWSFKGCTGLQEVDMTWADVTEIREGAFKNCSALTTIALPQQIQTLGDSCFYGIGAASFTVPDTVTSIEAWCFARSKLTEITFAGDAPVIGEGAFNKITLTALYNASASDWTAGVMQNYGGTVTWQAQ